MDSSCQEKHKTKGGKMSITLIKIIKKTHFSMWNVLFIYSLKIAKRAITTLLLSNKNKW
jgi:hypothetical protein